MLKKATTEITQLKDVIAKFNTEAIVNKRAVEPNKIYVGNMNPHSTSAQLKDYFKTFGTVINVFKNERSRFGFVEFADNHMAQAALNARPHKFGGKHVIVDKAKSTARRRAALGKENEQPLSMKSQKSENSLRQNVRFSPY